MSGPTSTRPVVSTSITGQPPATGRATSSFQISGWSARRRGGPRRGCPHAGHNAGRYGRVAPAEHLHEVPRQAAQVGQGAAAVPDARPVPRRAPARATASSAATLALPMAREACTSGTSSTVIRASLMKSLAISGGQEPGQEPWPGSPSRFPADRTPGRTSQAATHRSPAALSPLEEQSAPGTVAARPRQRPRRQSRQAPSDRLT